MKNSIMRMFNLIYPIFVLFIFCVLSCSKKDDMKGGLAMGDNTVEQTLIDMEKAALERWGDGDPDGFLEIIAEDYTYFDPFINECVRGFDNIKEIYESIRGKVNIDYFELISPDVQIYGDVAVLTFNFKSYAELSDGTKEEKTHWHTTEVFKKFDEGWKLISTHWSFTKRQLEKFDKIGAFTSDENQS